MGALRARVGYVNQKSTAEQTLDVCVPLLRISIRVVQQISANSRTKQFLSVAGAPTRRPNDAAREWIHDRVCTTSGYGRGIAAGTRCVAGRNTAEDGGQHRGTVDDQWKIVRTGITSNDI